ncbi:MAG: ribulose-phosphate 3-epimerase [Epulopiscium sp. Nuni2H_MBin003]|nr:MAG: ribulose-phosphate 3-epimerase [Epulopiscium sp. Nuni2H_MBin003]
MIHLAPSILAADFANLRRDIEIVENAGVKYLHVDVMDGHFVPNISIGAPVVKSIRPYTKSIMDVHLMIENPDQYIEEFAQIGADILTVHVETCKHLDRTIQLIKECKVKAGVAINPATPVSTLEEIIKDVDLVLIMSVNPGFGGQKFIDKSLTKIAQVKKMAKKGTLIEVDGGIKLANVAKVVKVGANVIVAGSAIYESKDVMSQVKKFYDVFEGVR